MWLRGAASITQPFRGIREAPHPNPARTAIKSRTYSIPAPIVRTSTGIAGLDEMTNGGLPSGRTTLLVGGPGSGKTILALQYLVHGARKCKEPGIFVCFEESPTRIAANAAGFGWNLEQIQPKKLFMLDAQPPPDLIQAGNFDLGGMLAVLDAKIDQMKARRIVFDAVDIVLDLLPDAAAKRREMYRLHTWLLQREITGLITLKTAEQAAKSDGPPLGFVQFMVDCAVMLNQSVTLGVSQRNLRVQKYRGSAYHENESPFLIGKDGFDVAVSRTLISPGAKVSRERVSSGVARLDTMLGGGYYRSSNILITGFPGTAKTTLSGAFAEAACKRGERTLFVSFDSDANEITRNLASVGILLDRYVKSGCLRVISARTITGSAETYLVRIKSLAKEHAARCLVIDPVSALSQSGNEFTAHSVAERLIDWSKADRTTLVCTSLIDELVNAADGGSPLHISTLADTWIHLNYLVQAGERNRSLSIIKSRGSAHSNQVRELILTDQGVTLADTYTAGGDVLMGTLRWEKESAARREAELAHLSGKHKTVLINAEEAEIAVRIKSLQVELAAKQAEKALLSRSSAREAGEVSQGRTRMRELRGADMTDRPKKPRYKRASYEAPG
jgi:circadian clock protein KaiC